MRDWAADVCGQHWPTLSSPLLDDDKGRERIREAYDGSSRQRLANLKHALDQESLSWHLESLLMSWPCSCQRLSRQPSASALLFL